MAHIKFPSIESFRHAVKFVRNRCDHHGKPYPTLRFHGEVKLHGTNAGVRMKKDGQLIAQSRERDITVGDDNAGFAAFVVRNADMIRQFMQERDAEVIFGEWIGPGIQKNVAINQLAARQFVMFGLVKDSVLFDYQIGLYVFCEGEVKCVVPRNETIDIDFNTPDAIVPALERLTAEFENECPYAKEFGISGIGEGLVWSAAIHSFSPWFEHRDQLRFKTKGEKHGNKSVKTDVKVAVSAERIEDFNKLFEKLLPAWRLEQGLSYMRENGIKASKHNTGEYLKWVAKDVLKEEEDYIAASGFDAKVIMAEVSKRARQFYFNNTEE